jgi:mono/diheme cytochrome c family protein
MGTCRVIAQGACSGCSFWGTVITLVFLILVLAPGQLFAVQADIAPDDLAPGLIATYRDAGKKTATEIVLLEPTIALALKKGEAAHPRLRADGGTIRWKGYLNILQVGSYRFSARLRGLLRVTVAGKPMFVGTVTKDAPTLKLGPPLRLEVGVYPLVAEFTRLPGPARVELFWQAPHIHKEPLPWDAVGHLPAKVPASFKASLALELGRFLAEEHSCAVCHRRENNDRLANGLLSRQGPDLSEAGARLYPGWIYAWLAAPQKTRPGAPMPAMFAPGAAGQTERYAVARYLASMRGPLKANGAQRGRKEQRFSQRRGRRLFTSVGCIACHATDKADKRSGARPFSLTRAATNFPIAGLGSKTPAEKLAIYLENPLPLDPSGRMPHMLLKKQEARDLARHLCAERDRAINRNLPDAPEQQEMLAAFKRVDDRPDEFKAFKHLPADAQWLDLGKRLVIDKGCNNCHTIAPGGKNFASTLASATFDEIKSPKVHNRGCLADSQPRAGKAPWFDLSKGDRSALRRFLREGTSGAGSPAPAYAGRVAIERFNCLACHSRNGEGGLTTKVIKQLRRWEKADSAEAVMPPPLTSAGQKLRTAWITDVMIGAGRARPWMTLRMPQFGKTNIGHLSEALAILDGTHVDAGADRVPLTPARIKTGRRLVGKQAFACINCHDIAGIASTGNRGPDLARMTGRVRYAWYRRWLEQAPQMQPGTRMPSIFPGGKSALDTILGGNPDAQAEAIWAYLSLGPRLPLPRGVERGKTKATGRQR